jgi:hypothetical protein
MLPNLRLGPLEPWIVIGQKPGDPGLDRVIE